jgi:hypothetical protein
MFENVPRWELRDVLCDGEVCEDLKEPFRRRWSGGSRRTAPTAGLDRRQRKVRTLRYAAQEDNEVGGYVPDGVCACIHDREGSRERTRQLK